MILDIVLLLLLVTCTLSGYRKGLIMSLMSLVIAVLCCLGAGVAQNKLTPAAEEYLTPRLEAMFLPSVQSDMQQGADELLEQAGETGFTVGGQTVTVSELAELLKGFGLDIQETVSEETGIALEPAAQLAAGTVAAFLAKRIAGMLIFFTSFLVLYLVLYNVALALNIVDKLPVLHTLNRAGGAILGLAGCLLVMVVAAMVVRNSSLLPAEPGLLTRGILELSQRVLPG